jgi:hypothetical protein
MTIENTFNAIDHLTAYTLFMLFDNKDCDSKCEYFINQMKLKNKC